MKAVLIEREAEYQTDIRRRVELCMAGPVERANASIKAKQEGKPRDDGPLFEWDEMWSRPFDKPGLVQLHCEIHQHMQAVILVLDTPCFVKTDTEGRFRLTGPMRSRSNSSSV